jgi:hypothetical protein
MICCTRLGLSPLAWGRDPEFEPKMAEILCVYRQVAMLRGHAATGQDSGGGESLAIISYDEKPGIQAIGTTAPDRPPLPGTSPTVMAITSTNATAP